MIGQRVVVALDRKVSRSVVDHVGELLGAGVSVCLVLIDESAVAQFRDAGDVSPHPLLEVQALLPDEQNLRLRRLLPGRLHRLYAAVVRPWLLGRRWRALPVRVDVAAAERLVAADVTAITLVWRLSRRYPHVVATTALDSPAVASRRAS